LKDPVSWKAKLKSIRKTNWVVYSKRPFGSTNVVLKYLARYTHRIAISNQRLVSMKDGNVTFRWKDYANGNQKREMTLKAGEFIRRFLLHVLPSRFQRIRQYGLLANRVRKAKLQLSRELLGQSSEPEASMDPQVNENLEQEHSSDSELCPACGKGRLLVVADLEPDRQLVDDLLQPEPIDTS
jgi:hypothetical protein